MPVAQSRSTRLPAVSMATLLALALAACDGVGAPEPGKPETPVPADPAAPAPDAPEQAPDAEVDPADPVAGGDPILTQVASLGGAMQAAIERCEPQHDAARLAEAKRQQRELFVQMGGDGAGFDSGFGAAYDKVRSEFASATPAQHKQLCDELAEVAAQAQG